MVSVMKTGKILTVKNPVIDSDFPDPDIIRVGNTYYMASTTMYFMPGCVILRSYDLVKWEILSHAYKRLDNTPRYYMEGNQNIYGQGMWAPTFRYHKGKYYIVFTSNDTHKSHLLTSSDPNGPWNHQTIEGWYHDSGLFFDDDDRVYIVHGQKTLYLTQLKADLSGPEENGLNRIVAQGGMVDTPDGDWYAFMFQDRGALGRAPVLMPMHFEDGFPIIGENGKVPEVVTVLDTGYQYAAINGSDDFSYKPDENGQITLKNFWEFNHQQMDDFWSVTENPGHLRLHSAKLSPTLFQAYNTLTQRTVGPKCAAEVTLRFAHMKNGDVAGISTFIGNYGFIGVKKENDQFYLIMMGRPAKDTSVFGQFEYENPGIEYARVPIYGESICLRAEADFTDKRDLSSFYYKEGDNWQKLGIDQPMYFKMDLFTGCRFGLFYYSTEQTGGYVDFSKFQFIWQEYVY